jgi:hypothetical protein
MRSVAGVWAVQLFITTYFDENVIFELSDTQTFRTRSTFMNPAQFLILVTQLVVVYRKNSEFIFARVVRKIILKTFAHVANHKSYSACVLPIFHNATIIYINKAMIRVGSSFPKVLDQMY